MKTFKKFIAIILCLATVFAVCASGSAASAATAEEPQNFEEYGELLSDGVPALTTKQFLNITKSINTAFGLLPEKEHFNFTADETLTELCNYIAEESGLDILMLVSNLPETKQYAEFVSETFNIDSAAMRDMFYELRDEQDAQGNGTMAMLCHFLGVYMGIIDECEAYCVPLEDENCYEIYLKITMRDGTVETVSTGVALNTETGEVYGKDGNGMLGIGYNLDSAELLLYAQVNVWMRDFGFTFLYDLFCYTTPFFFYNTRRIKFDYDGMEWMIQIWKGNYLVSNGAEVGIYTREPGSFGTYYDCANDGQMMNMSMKLIHGDDVLFERPLQEHWWLTGFQISNTLYPAKTLTLDFTIEMKDEEMLSAFCEAVENHYMNDMTYTVDGLTVNVVW